MTMWTLFQLLALLGTHTHREHTDIASLISCVSAIYLTRTNLRNLETTVQIITGMTSLNISSPFSMSTSLCNHASHFHRTNYSHNLYFYNAKPKYVPFSHHFSPLSSLLSKTRSTPSPRFSPMPSHFSKSGTVPSGSGCSWLQDNSVHRNASAGLLCSALPTKPAEVSSVQDLYDFICSGPLLGKLNLSPEKIAETIDKWIACNSYLCRLFQLNELYLTVPQKARFFHYYIPVFIWCEDQISQHMSQFKDGEETSPLVIGFSAPQGCGKTTLVFALDYLFKKTGRKSATISIDDFYLTAEGQAKLRETNPGNALLEYRGNAGSHDLQLSIETLTALSKLNKEGMKMKLPRYDKSAYSGRGDRADPSTWPEIEGPLTVVLFEGWMLGFKPLPTELVRAVDPQLETINKNLEAYYDAWDKFIKTWVVIKIKDPNCVFEWRLQAEIAMREADKQGMSDEEVRDFVSRYLPAYNAYLPTLYSEGPNGSDPKHLIIIEIDEGRNPF